VVTPRLDFQPIKPEGREDSSIFLPKNCRAKRFYGKKMVAPKRTPVG
jgi:hypothetical protein